MGTPVGTTRTWVAELIGPPGTGKSAVADVLAEHPGLRRVGILRSATRMPVLLGHATAIAVRTAARSASRPRSVQELRWMARLQASRSIPRPEEAVVFDQGPVYTLARLRESMRHPTPWLTRQFEVWAARLSIVVLLDATDDELLRRIEGRPKDHALKGLDAASARPALARWRALYAEVVSTLTAEGGPVVLRFDSGAETPEQIARQIIATVPGEPA